MSAPSLAKNSAPRFLKENQRPGFPSCNVNDVQLYVCLFLDAILTFQNLNEGNQGM